jgi:hypothetical protein
MNILEGARRIKRVGRICTIFGGSIAALLLAYSLLTRYTDLAFIAPHLIFWPFIFLSVYPLIGGVFLSVAGYIVEGFAQPAPKRPESN